VTLARENLSTPLQPLLAGGGREKEQEVWYKNSCMLDAATPEDSTGPPFKILQIQPSLLLARDTSIFLPAHMPRPATSVPQSSGFSSTR
jgi:hypothetical protein